MKSIIIFLITSLSLFSQSDPIKLGYHLQGEFIEIISCNKFIIIETGGIEVEVLIKNTECNILNPNHAKSIEYLNQKVKGKNADVLLDKSWFGRNKVVGDVMYGCWVDTKVKYWSLHCPNGSDNLFEELYRIGCIQYMGKNKRIKRFIKKYNKSLKKKFK